MQTLKAAEICCGDYRDVHIPPGAVIYADPPYYGTKGYREKFNHDAFWIAMRLLAETGHKVFISEQQAPRGFNCVWEKPFTRTLDRNKQNQFRLQKNCLPTIGGTMKAENILKYALNLRAVLDPNNEHSRPEDLEMLKAVNQMIPNDPHTLAALIIAECNAAETANAPAPAKKARKSKAVKAAEKMLKMSRDNCPEHKEYHYPQMPNGVQYITNCVSIVKLTTPLPLEEMPYDIAATGPLNLAEQFDKYTRGCTTPVGIPTALELAAYVKTHKGAEILTLDCGLSINAKYLLNALEVLDAKEVWAFADLDNDKPSVYIKTLDGAEALVFGRRRQGE